jgi:phosphatidylserine/phosphatidylglycerophosphate/cardiolipin synthase-like enzyme
MSGCLYHQVVCLIGKSAIMKPVAWLQWWSCNVASCMWTLAGFVFAMVGLCVIWCMEGIFRAIQWFSEFRFWMIQPRWWVQTILDPRWSAWWDDMFAAAYCQVGVWIVRVIALFLYWSNSKEHKREMPLNESVVALGRSNGYHAYTGVDVWSTIIQAIHRAEHRIWIATMYLRDMPNTLTRDIVDELNRKVEEGVEVRVMLDGYGAWWSDAEWTSSRWKFNVRTVGPPLPVASHHCYHSKYILIDDQTVGITGANLSDSYFQVSSAMRDTIVWFHRASERMVASLEYDFESVWEESLALLSPLNSVSIVPDVCNRITGAHGKRTGRNRRPINEKSLEPNHVNLYDVMRFGPTSDHSITHELVRNINHARESIVLCTMAWAPGPSVVRALVSALRRDVKLHILTVDAVSYTSPSAFLQPNAIAHPSLITLARMGAIVWKQDTQAFQNAALHSKWWVIDHTAYYGSANLTYYSMNRSQEIMVSIPICSLEQWVSSMLIHGLSPHSSSVPSEMFPGFVVWKELEDTSLDIFWRKAAQCIVGVVFSGW